MKVNSINKKNISFNGFYNSKALKSFLSFAEKNGAVFTSASALTLSATVRPAAILLTPNTDKENKKIACTKAITSTFLEFLITLAISMPIVKGVEAINKNPTKYLKETTIKNLQENSKQFTDSKAYNIANQMFKLGIGLAIAAPKAILNILGMPYINNFFFEQEKKQKQQNSYNTGERLIFKGKDKNFFAAVIGKTMDNKNIQNFSKKYSDSNFPMHINALKDTIATGTFIGGVNSSKNIDEKRKGALIYNSAIATGLSILSSYIIDNATKKSAQKFINKLKEANKNDPKLNKYINGFKIAKPILIMGVVYYTFIPVISTFLGERIDKKHPLSNK